MKQICIVLLCLSLAYVTLARPIYGGGEGAPHGTIIQCSPKLDSCGDAEQQEVEEYDNWTHFLPPDDKTTYDDFVKLSKKRACQPVSRNDYPNCLLYKHTNTFMGFHKHLSCMNIIELKENCQQAECTKNAPRRDLIGVASMLRGIGYESDFVCNIPVTDNLKDEPESVCQIIDGALKNKLISEERSKVRPERTMTRSEAYAVLMNSICMNTQDISLTYYPDTQDQDWQKKVITLAIKYGFTVKDAYTFDPNDPILMQEFYTATSRIVAHAQRHGGCPPITNQACE